MRRPSGAIEGWTGAKGDEGLRLCRDPPLALLARACGMWHVARVGDSGRRVTWVKLLVTAVGVECGVCGLRGLWAPMRHVTYDII
jgi:hypothetical protein